MVLSSNSSPVTTALEGVDRTGKVGSRAGRQLLTSEARVVSAPAMGSTGGLIGIRQTFGLAGALVVAGGLAMAWRLGGGPRPASAPGLAAEPAGNVSRQN